MVDRQDIDALLIGSLYGELSSADEARLLAHLESHPADRGVLESLGRAREAVRASRIFEVQLEPAQSVSARLLQEAARRAPRQADSEGWFARLRRSFLMHPAMAAAAMFVVVVGVAGTMYMRKGDHFAAPDISAPQNAERARGAAPASESADPVVRSYGMEPSEAPSPAVTSKLESAPIRAKDAPGAAATGTAQDRRDAGRYGDVGSYRVGVADSEGQPSEAQKKSAEQGGNTASKADTAAAEPAARPEPKAEKAKVPPAAGPGMLEVTTPRRMPKDLDEERPKQEAKGRAQVDDLQPTTPPPPPAPAPAADAGDELAKRGNAQSRPAVRAPDVMPAAPAAAKPQSAAGGMPSAGAGAATGNADDKSVAGDPNLAWARDQHSRLVTQVRAGRCTDAAGTAVTLSNRAPGYYQQNVANDRAVKDCLAYINAERERAAEADRARAASSRMSADEAAAPAPTKAGAKPASRPGAKSPDRAEKAAPAKAPAPSTTKSN
jgi:hypothetical protein